MISITDETVKQATIPKKEQVKTTTDMGTKLFSGEQEIQRGCEPSDSGSWSGSLNRTEIVSVIQSLSMQLQD